MDALTYNGIDVPKWKCHQSLKLRGEPTVEITMIGIDWRRTCSKSMAVDRHGKAVLRKPLRRDQVAPFFANLAVRLIGIEVCNCAHQSAQQAAGDKAYRQANGDPVREAAT